jgi:hypothetical protein
MSAECACIGPLVSTTKRKRLEDALFCAGRFGATMNNVANKNKRRSVARKIIRAVQNFVGALSLKFTGAFGRVALEDAENGSGSQLPNYFERLKRARSVRL